MGTSFSDHFAPVASHYADSRPTYPTELFRWLANQCDEHQLAWDCGAGNGQASYDLANYFAHVIATDASAAQLAQARPHPSVTYRQATAENSGLADHSVDLVTIAQALHWFPFSTFFAEAQRVLKENAVFAAWSYGPLTIENPAINRLVQDFYHQQVGAYWPPERHHVETGYREIPCPFPRIAAPTFTMEVAWNFSRLMNYFRSWSATARFLEAKGFDPVAELERKLRPLWKEEAQEQRVTWPLTLLVGRNH